ncbi:Ionotropic receptor 147, partial [Hyalella azteca]
RKAGPTLQSKSIVNSSMLVISVLLQKGQKTAGKMWKTSVFLLTLWLLTSLILCVVYSTNLLATLVLPRVSIPFDSLQGLLEQNEVLLHMSVSSIFRQALEDAEPGTLLNKLNKKVGGYETDASKITQDVIEGKYAFITLRNALLGTMNDLFSKTGKCGIQVTTETSVPVTLSYMFAKELRIKTDFDRVLRESGILNKVLNDKLSNVTVCLKPGARVRGERGERALEIADFYGLFMVYAAGIIVSTSVFVGEQILNKLSRPSSHPTQEPRRGQPSSPVVLERQ